MPDAEPKMVYEVYPDDEGRWILYLVGGGDFLAVAWFSEKADAEFAQEAFARRDGLEVYAPTGSKG